MIPRRERYLSAMNSRKGRKPSVVVYWSAVEGSSSMTRNVAFFRLSVSIRADDGSPPANDITEGSEETLKSSLRNDFGACESLLAKRYCIGLLLGILLDIRI
jgi:hypothetical protein